IVEQDFPLEKDKDLQCTRTGQVLSDLHGKSCFDLNAELAAEFAKGRKESSGKELQKAVGETIGVTVPMKAGTPDMLGSIARQNQTVDRGLLKRGNFPLPALGLGGSSTDTKAFAVVIHDRGKEAFLDSAIESLGKSNSRVFLVDLRGYGETSPGAVPETKRS